MSIPVTLYYNSPVMTQHVPPRGAIEEPARIVGIEAHLKGHPVTASVAAWRTTGTIDLPVKAGSLWSACQVVEANSITDQEVATEYGDKMVRKAEYNTPVRGSKYDPACGDIYWSPGTWEAAKTAAGAATEAALAVAEDKCNAFCIVRPPGHHCFDVPAGFCILNNVVLAARKLLAAGRRVAIIDWDYHFGDGTAAALWGEENVMFVSLHAERTRQGYMTYPARTARNFKGAGLRKATGGRCFNIQWAVDDADDAAYAYAFKTCILPAIQQFAPDVILVSAGYDAIRGDDLAGMNVTPAAFGYMAAALTSKQPVVAVLEGGYNVNLLAEGVGHTVAGLLGHIPATDVATWLDQMPQANHKAVVDEAANYVLGGGLDSAEV